MYSNHYFKSSLSNIFYLDIAKKKLFHSSIDIFHYYLPFQLNSVYNLLENRWTTDPSNTHCEPVSIRMSARYQGITGGQRTWEFTINAIGENLVESSAAATIQGTSSDYFRIVFTFSGTLGGSVTNRGQTGSVSAQSVEFNGDNRNLGST